MANNYFKTPLPKTPNSHFHTPGKPAYSSDSEESIASTTESVGSGIASSSGGELSLVAEFDDLMRIVKQKRSTEAEEALLSFAEQMRLLIDQQQIVIEECQRLKRELDFKVKEISTLENAMALARKVLDKEKKRTHQVERERDILLEQIGHVREVLFHNENNKKHLTDDTKEKLAFLNNTCPSYKEEAKGLNGHLSAIQEINSTGSLLSDFSYSRSEDDLDASLLQCGKKWKKHRPSTTGVAEPAPKKRRSSGSKVVEIAPTDTLRATTTLTVNNKGPITATSVIESIPPRHSTLFRNQKGETPTSTPSAPPANLVFESWNRASPYTHEKNNLRKHTFLQKIVVMPDTCGPCEKRIRFGKTAMKCKECRAVCHVECKDFLPLPCIPVISTPNQGHIMGLISDYTPTMAPMVPALIVHCVNEIELRGLNELGIYRIPGNERDVKALKERFLKGRGAPCLNQTDIHVICGTVKDFLRSLNEPLVTYKLWKELVKAVEAKDEVDIQPALYEILSQLPQPNRDTLAYLILHLQKIAESPDCKMPIGNLSKVFGPTIIGYSSEDPDPSLLMRETILQNKVMEYLLKIPKDYWASFINVNQNLNSQNKLQQTPSTDSLLRQGVRGYFTPKRSADGKRKQRFFPTPPKKK